MEKCKICGKYPNIRGAKYRYCVCAVGDCCAGPMRLTDDEAVLSWNKLMRVEPAPVVKDDNTAMAPLHMCATNTSICVHEINKWHHQRE